VVRGFGESFLDRGGSGLERGEKQQALVRLLRKLLQRAGMGDARNLIASALLAGFQGDLLPAFLFARSLLLVESQPRSGG